MWKTNNVGAQYQQCLQMDKNSIESTKKAITSDPSFKSTVVAALGSNRIGGQALNLKQSFSVLSSFLSTNTQALTMRLLSPPLTSSSSKCKSTSPEDNQATY